MYNKYYSLIYSRYLPENAKTSNRRPLGGEPTHRRTESTKMETLASNQNAKFADKAGIAAHYKVCPRTINEWMRIGLLVFFRVKRARCASTSPPAMSASRRTGIRCRNGHEMPRHIKVRQPRNREPLHSQP